MSFNNLEGESCRSKLCCPYYVKLFLHNRRCTHWFNPLGREAKSCLTLTNAYSSNQQLNGEHVIQRYVCNNSYDN